MQTPVRQPGSHALHFILLTIFIDTLGFGIIIPILPQLIAELGHTDIANAASYGGALMFVFALLHFLFAPVLGNLADRFGRRPVLLVSLATLAVDYLIMGLATGIGWLFVGRALAGVSSATFATANAYIADITTETERPGKFGLVGAAWGLGFVAGPVLGGVLADLGPRTPFFAAAALAVVNVIYGLLVLPETLAPANRRPFRFARANPIGAFNAFRPYPLVITLFGALVLYFMAHDVHPSTWTYYVIEQFGWSAREVGLGLAAVGVASAVVSGTLVGPLVRRLGGPRAVAAGLILAAISFFGYAFATASWMLIPCIIIGGFMGLVMPALRGILSAAVPADQQGELQGAISSVMGLTAIVSPLVMTQTFRAFSGPDAPAYFPGASYLLAGLLALGALAIVRLALRRQHDDQARP